MDAPASENQLQGLATFTFATDAEEPQASEAIEARIKVVRNGSGNT